jgi:hypothetical protein
MERNQEDYKSEVEKTLQEDILAKLEAAYKMVDSVAETFEDDHREDLPKVDDVMG